MEILKLLSANELVAQIITFIILLFLMKRFMWTPLLKSLDERRAKIAEGIKQAEDAKLEAEKIRADYDKKLSGIEVEARKRIDAAVDEGRKAAEEIRLAARVESDKIISKAQESIKQEVAKAEEELKDTIANLAVDVAAQVIQERLTTKDDRAIAETFIKKIEKA